MRKCFDAFCQMLMKCSKYIIDDTQEMPQLRITPKEGEISNKLVTTLIQRYDKKSFHF